MRHFRAKSQHLDTLSGGRLTVQNAAFPRKAVSLQKFGSARNLEQEVPKITLYLAFGGKKRRIAQCFCTGRDHARGKSVSAAAARMFM